MSATFYYIAFDGSWTVNLGTQAIRLGSGFSFTELAELGAVGSGSIVIDDPTGTAGHSSDGILGLQQFYVTEALASPIAVFRGWTGPRTYRRGQNDSLITGAARKIEVSLNDANTLAGRLIIQPKALDATVARPAETPSARISWLLGTTYFSGVADNGYVSPASGTLDANDYSGQSAADVLNDCCVLTGDNWFVYWDRTTAAWSLAVFNMTTYWRYTGTLKLSNDLSEVDSNVNDGAGSSNTWAVYPDATLTRDPATYCDGVLLPYAKGTVYRTATSTTFPNVDHTAPSTSVKTSTLADTQADRFLTDNADETDRITCSADIAAANVNDALSGQTLYATFTHLPGYATSSPFRIARRTVSQQQMSDQFYTCTYELVPAAPVVPTSSFARIEGFMAYDHLVGPTGATFSIVQFQNTSEVPHTGYPVAAPKSGLMDYDTTGHTGPSGYLYTGIKMLGGGSDIEVYCQIAFGFTYDVGSGPGGTTTLDILLNGVSVGSQTKSDPGSGLHTWGGSLVVDVTGVTVANGDIFTAKTSWSHAPHAANQTIGVAAPRWFWAAGTLV